MPADPTNQVFRLPKRHSRDAGKPPDPALGARLVRAQSLRAAVTASLIVIIVFSVVWTMLSSVTDRVLPWMTLVQAALLGLAVRRAGRGLDWRFPALAAVMSVAGALVANIVVAASGTAAEFGTDTLTVLRAVTSMTWPVFFDEVMTAADIIYALGGAGVAAFLANRRLDRREFGSLRLWKQENEKHGSSK